MSKSERPNDWQEDSASQTTEPAKAQSKKKLRPATIVLALVIVACLAGAGYGAAQMLDAQRQIEDAQNAESVEPATPDEEQETVELEDNPINFEKLQKQNKDIYAWIYVPNTNVNHAVLQHSKNNAYYLDHDENKESSVLGAVFSENFNTKDFTDAVTVLYGHNSNNQAMFSTLHYFEDKAFFKENKKFYIYTPGHIYTYKIVSAFTTDDRHILYKNKYFQTYEQLRAFESEILDPHSIEQNTRKASLDDNSKIVVLSTCNSGAQAKHGRYIVCGVMTNDQQTN